MFFTTATLAIALAQGLEPSPGGVVHPLDVQADVQTPDATSLLRGRQAVTVVWRANLGGCSNPSFRVEVTAGGDGRVVGRGELHPSHAGVDWEGYALTLEKVPATVVPQIARVQGCCGFTCSSKAATAPVNAFLTGEIWSTDHAEHSQASLLLGTDGRGNVWLASDKPGGVLKRPLLGSPEPVAIGDAEPLAITRIGAQVWLTATDGIHRYHDDEQARFEPVLDTGDEAVAVAARQSIANAAGPQVDYHGPCAIGERGTIWCRLKGARAAEPVATVGGERVADARVQGHDLWILLGDARLLRLDLDTPEAGLTAILTQKEISAVAGHRQPLVLGGIPGTGALWLGDATGHIWRVEVDDPGHRFDPPIVLPQPFWEVLQVESDGLDRVAILTSHGLCTRAGETLGCRGEDHGWARELAGIGWALPGVLWVGDHFLLTAPSTLPSMGWAYASALGVGILLLLLLVALAAYRIKGLLGRGPRAVVEALVAEVAQEVGWGPAIAAIALPQGLVLAVDRLMADLGVAGAVSSRLFPAVFFLVAFLVGLQRAHSPAPLRELAGRQKLPALLLVSLVWALFLTLWVWPPGPLASEVDGTVTLTHLALAVVTGFATLLYLTIALGRERA